MSGVASALLSRMTAVLLLGGLTTAALVFSSGTVADAVLSSPPSSPPDRGLSPF